MEKRLEQIMKIIETDTAIIGLLETEEIESVLNEIKKRETELKNQKWYLKILKLFTNNNVKKEK